MADLYKNDAATRNFIHKAAALPGADPGEVNWVASHPPLGCAVSRIVFVWALSDLLKQSILVNEVYDEMQISHSDRE